MIELHVLEEILRHGFVPNFPVFVVTHEDGRTKFELVRENELWRRAEQGVYASHELLTRVPLQDERERPVDRIEENEGGNDF